MKKLSKFTWLPNIPATQQPSRTSKILLFILYFLILYVTINAYGFNYGYSWNPPSFILLVICWFIFFAYQAYINCDPIIYKDKLFHRFTEFHATLQEVIAIPNPKTDYHYQIKIHTDEPISQERKQEWLITPSLYPINLRILVGHQIYIESLANSPLIFNLKPYLLDQNQQEIFFTQRHLEYPNTNGQYKKCRYNNIQKVELDTSQKNTQLFIWITQQKIQITLDESQLKLMETIFFPKLLMFSQRQYLAVRNQHSQGIIWQS